MKDKIAEIINEHCIDFQMLKGKDSPENQLADKILDCFKNIRVEVECPECGGYGYLGGFDGITWGWSRTNLKKVYCSNDNCKKGITYRPATPEEMEIGGILKIK